MPKLPLGRKLELERSESGQALLIILLTMSVVLSVVLSVVSRSLTEVSVTTFEENATRAFSAAEAGVEQALLTGESSSGSLDTSTQFTASVSTPSYTSVFPYPADLISGQSATFWFVSHNDTTGALTCSGKPCLRANRIDSVCWGAQGTPAGSPSTPAIEVSIFYDTSQGAISSGNYSAVNVARMAFDPNSSRRSSNFFSDITAGCNVGGTSYPYAFSTGNITFTGASAVIPIPCWNTNGCLLAAKVRIFYNDLSPQPIFISVNPTGGTSLPAQGTQIDSKGTSGESTRRVNVFQSYPEAPFDVAVSSLKDLVK